MNIISPRKLQGRKICKKVQILVCSTFLVYSFTALICCLFCSYPLRFPSMKHFLYVSLPNVYSLFISPKCLFIVGNIIIIVIFLCESKVFCSNVSPSTIEVFERHTETNPTRQHLFTIEDDKEEVERGLEKQMNLVVRRECRSDVDQENECQVKKENNVKEQEVLANDQLEEDEEEADHEELTRKVENFIARVNRQRWLEANSIVCCRA